MGLAGGLVRRVFSKHRSPCDRDCNVDKSRWSLSKLNFCGDDFDSVHAEVNDFTSFDCSELTGTQLAAGASETSMTEASWQVEEESDEGTDVDANAQDKQGETNSEEQSAHEEYAAAVIQSAFRKFMARRRQQEQMEALGDCHEMESPSRASMATSVEVQAGDSVKNLSVHGASFRETNRVKQKVITRASRMKEEWDDSTVSSNISKLRVQNRLEAMTRRERALAYAFSQQLRLCSNKKKQARQESEEPNTSWNWLERWMATRHTENPLTENCSSRQHQSCTDHRPSILRRKSDVDLKESCGSNDVPLGCENSVIPSFSDIKDGYKAVKNRLKAPMDAKRKNTAQPNRVLKSLREMEKEKQQMLIQAKSVGSLHS